MRRDQALRTKAYRALRRYRSGHWLRLRDTFSSYLIGFDLASGPDITLYYVNGHVASRSEYAAALKAQRRLRRQRPPAGAAPASD